jgi:uncharacterized protein (DUF58 family)
MSDPRARPFPLVPRRRFLGVQFGRRRSARRGEGDEVAGTRPYRPGDLTARIHWPASARLSAARGTDEFVVREFFAEQAPRVALVVDRRPGVAIYEPPAPWLDKRAALEEAARLIAASTAAERGELAYVDAAGGRPFWLKPSSRSLRAVAQRDDVAFDAPEDSLRIALSLLLRHAALFPSGSFVFVVSDFLAPPPPRLWMRLRSLQWDVVPVVVQDPVWEQSFPPVGGVVLPLIDPATGRSEDVWVSPREARERASANERRHAALLERFRRLGFDPVVLDSAEPGAIADRLHEWARRRRRLMRTRQ